MAYEYEVTLRKEDNGVGLSLYGNPGLPPIIYEIIEHSPAADCRQVEVGDVLLQINGIDVSKFTTKEVLRCLRLSSNPVTLRLLRDVAIKDKLLVSFDSEEENYLAGKTSPIELQETACEMPRYETYLMTGDRVLKLTESKMPFNGNKVKQNEALSDNPNWDAVELNANNLANGDAEIDKPIVSQENSSEGNAEHFIIDIEAEQSLTHNDEQLIVNQSENQSESNAIPFQSNQEENVNGIGELLNLTEEAANFAKLVLNKDSAPNDLSEVKSNEEEEEEEVEDCSHEEFSALIINESKNRRDIVKSKSQDSISSTRAVDHASAVRLANRLYSLDGFKKSDVHRHLIKNNEFTCVVADEYLKKFDFTGETLDVSLRKFLNRFRLDGETQERERILTHFSKRYWQCDSNLFSSEDVTHTLTCALLLLNADLHGPITSSKMSFPAFVSNVNGAAATFNTQISEETLKMLYESIRKQPLQWPKDEDDECSTHTSETHRCNEEDFDSPVETNSQNSARDMLQHKSGYVWLKQCTMANGKTSVFRKRKWKLYYATMKQLTMQLFRYHDDSSNQQNAVVAKSVKLHHSLASVANNYFKRSNVFRLVTSDGSEYLIQTSDDEELRSWIQAINFTCARYSSPALPQAVASHSDNKYRPPILPSVVCKSTLEDQISAHRNQVIELQNALGNMKMKENHNISQNLKKMVVKKDVYEYIWNELSRYRIYCGVLEAHREANLTETMATTSTNQAYFSMSPEIPLYPRIVTCSNRDG